MRPLDGGPMTHNEDGEYIAYAQVGGVHTGHTKMIQILQMNSPVEHRCGAASRDHGGASGDVGAALLSPSLAVRPLPCLLGHHFSNKTFPEGLLDRRLRQLLLARLNVVH